MLVPTLLLVLASHALSQCVGCVLNPSPLCGTALAFNPPTLPYSYEQAGKTFTVVMTQAPSVSVQVALNLQGFKFSVNQLSFTTQNWNIPQSVTIVSNAVAKEAGGQTLQLAASIKAPCSPLDQCAIQYAVQVPTFHAGKTCSIVGDPHISQFSKRVSNFQDVGVFYYLKSPNLEVQGGQYACSKGSQVACVARVSVRYGDNVVTVDAMGGVVAQGGHKVNTDQAGIAVLNVLSNDGSIVINDVPAVNKRHAANSSNKFTFPDGSAVLINTGKTGRFSVSITVPASYKDLTLGGICMGQRLAVPDEDNHFQGEYVRGQVTNPMPVSANGYVEGMNWAAADCCAAPVCNPIIDPPVNSMSSVDPAATVTVTNSAAPPSSTVAPATSAAPPSSLGDPAASAATASATGANATSAAPPSPVVPATSVTPASSTVAPETSAASPSSTGAPATSVAPPSPLVPATSATPPSSTNSPTPSTTPSPVIPNLPTTPCIATADCIPVANGISTCVANADCNATTRVDANGNACSANICSLTCTAPYELSSLGSSTLPGTTCEAPSPTYTPDQTNNATTQCTQVLTIPGCSNLPGINLPFYIDSCVSDLLVTGSHDFTQSSFEALQSDCAHIAQCVIAAPVSVANQTAIAEIVQVSHGYGENNCPSNCNGGNGVCGSTGCICNRMFGGVDCGINLALYVPPTPPQYVPAAPAVVQVPTGSLVAASVVQGNQAVAPVAAAAASYVAVKPAAVLASNAVWLGPVNAIAFFSSLLLIF
ncbi:hypothetical protein HDU98_009571 [Podochytrium sp. JEL0797]|nr:hypothetical protein HDU98_009571 [Podochytrium sp. JEL0797]